ncbi:MAG TPA: hypothetical protein ENH59_03200 [Bacteroidetes bacterium]|nr:hypothetical protein [Bacteroidota bacterium]
MNKTAIYIIIIIFLLVTNLATIFTIVSLNRKEKEGVYQRPVIEMPRDNRVGYFHNQLGIGDEQLPAFRDYNRQFNMEAGELTVKMRELRHQMVDEMASEKPDTALLNEIASEFGRLHEEMKKLTMQYYFNLKSISDDQQKERLHFMFRDMLDPAGSIYGRGRGGEGRGMRRTTGRIQRDFQFE